MKVIIINGYAGVGKSTFVKYCKEYGDSIGLQIKEYSTIDHVKEIAREVGWDGQKTPESRKFLSDLKDLITNYNNFLFKEIVNKIKRDGENGKELVVFVHCREPEEIQEFQKALSAKSLIIRRKKAEAVVLSNHGDRSVFHGLYNYTIYNNEDLENLKLEAQKFINKIVSEDWRKDGKNY